MHNSATNLSFQEDFQLLPFKIKGQSMKSASFQEKAMPVNLKRKKKISHLNFCLLFC